MPACRVAQAATAKPFTLTRQCATLTASGLGCTPGQGRKRRRTSSFKGVTKAGRRWRASLRVNNQKRELGTFDDEIEAARCARARGAAQPAAAVAPVKKYFTVQPVTSLWLVRAILKVCVEIPPVCKEG